MKIKLYNFINIFFLILSIFMVGFNGFFNLNFKVSELIILIFLLVIVHVIKFIRIYFILLEESIPLKKRIKLYIKTTFVSITLPYKTGELFKMYSYGYQINDYAKGVIAVLIDKFFDAIVLCLVLIPYGGGSNLIYILLAFIIITVLVYQSFENTYSYLNKYLITRSKKRKSIIMLKLLEKARNIYLNARNMVKGRQIVLLFLTAINWIIEGLFVYLLALFMNNTVNFMDITNYVSDAFFGINNILFNNYIYICTIMFLIVTVYIYVRKFIDGGK